MERNRLHLLVVNSDKPFASGLMKEMHSLSPFPLEMEFAPNLRQALEKRKSADIVLLDLFLPDSQGLRTFNAIHDGDAGVPVIILLEPRDIALGVEAVKAGAQDCLLKEQIDIKGILHTITHVVERWRIFKDWKEVVDEKFDQAAKDPLTGLPNRLLFQDRLNMALSEAKRRRKMVGLFFIDLDHFKEVNDQRGHEVGDQLLVSVAKRWVRCIRTEDTVARMGGDEFVILIRDLPSSEYAVSLAKRLLQILENPFYLRDPAVPNIRISASIGISLYPPDGENGAGLLKCADTAMFRVKRRGGSGFEFFDTPAREEKQEGEGPGRRSILVVEDDDDFRFFLHKRLVQAGYSCDACGSVEEAVDALKSSLPDLVVLDLGFRNASGIALLQNLSRYLKDRQKIPPVLVVSGYSDPEIIDFATTLGARGFISKPVNDAQLLSRIRSLIH